MTLEALNNGRGRPDVNERAAGKLTAWVLWLLWELAREGVMTFNIEVDRHTAIASRLAPTRFSSGVQRLVASLYPAPADAGAVSLASAKTHSSR